MAQETIVQPKIKIVSSVTYPHVVHDLLSSVKLKTRYFSISFLCPFNESLWGKVPYRFFNLAG